MGYRVVVKIAGVGDRYQEEDGTITTSKTGHVWLTLVNDQTGEEFNFGFHPANEGSPFSKIGVVRTDDYRYLDVTYQRSLAISADQFNKLYAICQNALENHTFGMYLGGYNACPEFAFDALLQARIGNKMLIPTANGEGIIVDVTQKLVANIPTGNIGLLRYMADHNEKYIAPALSGSGLDGRDTSNRTNVISNTKASASSDLTTSIVTKQDSNSTLSSTTLPNFSEATFAQKFQYNFQTILGPSNPAFIDATLNDQDIEYDLRLDYNPNGVLWRVNAAGTPHPYDYDYFIEQNRVINAATNQTITELQGSGDFSVTSSGFA